MKKKISMFATLMALTIPTSLAIPVFAESHLAKEDTSDVVVTTEEKDEAAVEQTEVIVTTEDVDKLVELSEGADEITQINQDTFIVTYESQEAAKKAEEEIFAEEEVILTEDNQLFEISDDSDTEVTKGTEKTKETEETPSVEESDNSDEPVDYSTCPYRQIADEDGKKLVAVIDTGVDPDLVIHSVNFTAEESIDDVNGHGTAVAKKILENADDNAYLISIKAMNDNGSGYMSVIMKAIQYAIDQKVDVINLSIAAPDRGTAVSLTQLITTAIDNGITVVASAGNYNSSAKLYLPGSIEGVVSVGAMDEKFNKTETSNYAADYYQEADSTSLAAGVMSGKIVAGVELEKEKTDSDIEYEIQKINTGVLSLGSTTKKMDDDGVIIATAPLYVNISYNVRQYMNDLETECKKVIVAVNDISAAIDELYENAFYDSTYSSYIYTFENEELCDAAFNKIIEGNDYYGIIISADIDDLMSRETNAYSVSVKLKNGEGLNDAVASLNANIDGFVIATGKYPLVKYKDNDHPSNYNAYKYIATFDNQIELTKLESISEIIAKIKINTTDTNTSEDREKPTFVEYADVIIISKGSTDFTPYSSFKAIDNSGSVSINIEGYDINAIGTYHAKAIAVDPYGNTETRGVTINVVESANDTTEPDTTHFNYQEEFEQQEEIPIIYPLSKDEQEELFEIQNIAEDKYSIEQIPEEMIGNSGRLFRTLDEAREWAISEETDKSSEWYNKYPVYRRVSPNSIDESDDPWTVDFV